MAIDRVQVMIRETTATGGADADEEDFPHPINPNTDAPEMRRAYFQNDSSRDITTYVERDVNNNLVLVDTIAGTRKLVDLAWVYDILLNNEPVSPDITYTPTYASGRLTDEEWKRTVGSAKVRTITYTYGSGRVATEVRKAWDVTGLIVFAQVTWNYAYTNGLLSSKTMTRDV